MQPPVAGAEERPGLPIRGEEPAVDIVEEVQADLFNRAVLDDLRPSAVVSADLVSLLPASSSVDRSEGDEWNYSGLHRASCPDNPGVHFINVVIVETSNSGWRNVCPMHTSVRGAQEVAIVVAPPSNVRGDHGESSRRLRSRSNDG